MDAMSEGPMSMNNGASCRAFRIIFRHILDTMNAILEERPDLSQYNRFVREAIVGKMVNPNVVNI
jgi:uncharacterized protein